MSGRISQEEFDRQSAAIRATPEYQAAYRSEELQQLAADLAETMEPLVRRAYGLGLAMKVSLMDLSLVDADQ